MPPGRTACSAPFAPALSPSSRLSPKSPPTTEKMRAKKLAALGGTPVPLSLGSRRGPCRFFACIGTRNLPGCGSPVRCPAFRRSGPAKAGTPNGRFMESPLGHATVLWDHEPMPSDCGRSPSAAPWEAADGCDKSGVSEASHVLRTGDGSRSGSWSRRTRQSCKASRPSLSIQFRNSLRIFAAPP
jgi:hypothetical protein